MQGGTALSPWALQEDPESVALKFGEIAGYVGEGLVARSIEGLAEYLRQQPADELCKLAEQYVRDRREVRVSISTRSISCKLLR